MITRKTKKFLAAVMSVAVLAFGTFAPVSFSFVNDTAVEVKASASWETRPDLFRVDSYYDTTDVDGNVIHRFTFWRGDIIVGYYEGSDEAFVMHVAKQLMYNDEIYIPAEIGGKTITGIDYNAFNGCTITRVVLPDTLKTIDSCAFLRSHIKELTIPDSVETIGDDAFAYSNFEKIVYPKSVTSAESYMFNGCSSLKSVTFNGPVSFADNVFKDCTALEEVSFPEGSKIVGKYTPFSNCPKLKKINGMDVYSYETDSRGNKKPVLNEDLIPVIKEYFKSADSIGFIDDYCTDMCNYIVAAETDPWMNDFLKARQLYDWVIRHCRYEDQKNGELYSDTDNHLSSSVLLSAALNERGEGIGESVCDGFSQTYNMLLSAAGIESYLLSTYNHSWNAVVINNTYYQCDPTWDNTYYFGSDDEKNEYSTCYECFMKSNSEMTAIHGSGYANPSNSTSNDSTFKNHPLLTKYTDFNRTKCLSTTGCIYQDENQDGIVDYDYDLDGKPLAYDFMDDLTAVHLLQTYIYPNESEASMNNRLGECLYNLHFMHKSWWEYVGR